MSSQAKILSDPLELRPSSAGDSPASLTALQENARHLLMNVILRENSKESFGRLNPDGSLLKMSQGYAQVNLDGFLESSCMTFPKWGILSDGVVGELSMSEHVTEGNGYSLLLSTPMASDAAQGEIVGRRDQFYQLKLGRWRKKTGNGVDGSCGLAREIMLLPTCTSRDHKGGTVERIERGNPKRALDCEMQVHGLMLQPAFAEWMMGFPDGWTALNASEMPSSRNKSIRSSKQSQTLSEV